MNKTIAIIELYQHDEVLRHYCDLLSDSSYNIKVFCSKTVFENIKDGAWMDKFDWHIQENHASIPEFLQSNYSSFQSCELLFVTTALSHFKAFYTLSKIKKTLLLVHNAHSFLAPGQSLFFQEPLQDRLRWLKITFNRSHFYQKKLLGAVFAMAFPTEIILDYVKDKFEIPGHLKLLALPFVYFREKEKIQQEKITVTIPCTVISELRDYESVLNAFSKIKTQLKENIRLVLLGKPKGDGKKIIESFHALKSDQFEVITFKTFIPAAEYERWLLSTDFLILPLKKSGKNYIYKEWLGYSKISGSVNDMIRYGIPALIPEHYPLDNALKTIANSYTNNELAKQIENWITNQTFTKLISNRAELLKIYGREKMQQEFLRKMDSLM